MPTTYVASFTPCWYDDTVTDVPDNAHLINIIDKTLDFQWHGDMEIYFANIIIVISIAVDHHHVCRRRGRYFSRHCDPPLEMSALRCFPVLCPQGEPVHRFFVEFLLIHVLDPKAQIYLLPLLGDDENGQLPSVYAPLL